MTYQNIVQLLLDELNSAYGKIICQWNRTSPYQGVKLGPALRGRTGAVPALCGM